MNLFFLLFTLFANATCPYPSDWWIEVEPKSAPEWEILPQSVNCNENKVILSKRTELGIFSNFAATPFVLDGQTYASIEGFWQMMKYPENSDDPRYNPKVTWKYTREEVAAMAGSKARTAGDLANDNMKKLNINWVTYHGERIAYKAEGQQTHYQIILRATRAKLEQNPEVKTLLIRTGDLQLLPDHKQDPISPPAYRYFDIWMLLRSENKNR